MIRLVKKTYIHNVGAKSLKPDIQKLAGPCGEDCQLHCITVYFNSKAASDPSFFFK